MTSNKDAIKLEINKNVRCIFHRAFHLIFLKSLHVKKEADIRFEYDKVSRVMLVLLTVFEKNKKKIEEKNHITLN